VWNDDIDLAEAELWLNGKPAEEVADGEHSASDCRQRNEQPVGRDHVERAIRRARGLV
jgi:hypothetical protein